MGLFGALFAGVAGLGSQSNKIGIVSNNISNVNTVGFKEGAADFSTLVVPGSASGVFSPGGVLGNNQQLVDQQGLIQATTSNTDMAISGGGFFVVNTKPDGSGDTEYTRAGSFTPDASGNFVNSAGLYLQGMPVINGTVSDPAQRKLVTVNVNQNATGSSVATTSITLAANFNADQAALAGSGETTSLTGDPANESNSAVQILVPTADNGLVRGDSFQSVVNGALPNTFTYGGFTESRSITTGAGGDAATTLVADTITAGGTVTSNGTTTATISGINVANTGVASATASGKFSPGTLTYDGVSITIAAGDTLSTIASNLQTALRTRDGGTDLSTVALSTSGSPYSLIVTDLQDSNSTFGGTALTANTPTFTINAPVTNAGTTTSTITGLNVADENTTAATSKGLFEAGGTLTYDGKNVSIGNTDTLDTIAANLQTALRTRVGDINGPGGSTVAVTQPGGVGTPFTITVTDILGDNSTFSGTAVTGGTVGVTPNTPANVNNNNYTSTVTALTGIAVTNKLAAGEPFTDGIFTAGATFTVGGATVTLAGTESLQGIADDITNALQNRSGLPADTTSSATVTGGPGNYNIQINDTRATGDAISGFPTGTSFKIAAPNNVPSDTQISFTLNSSAEANNYVIGQKAYINGVTGALATSVNNQQLTVVNISGSTVTLGLPANVTSATGTAIGGNDITLTNRSYDFKGNILDASNPTDDLLGESGASSFDPSSLGFTATVNGTSYIYTYSSTPNTANGQFDSLSTLVTAINSHSDGSLTASVVNNQLFVSPTDTSQGVTFTNNSSSSATLPSINWTQELGLTNISAAPAGISRFDSLQSLADQINKASPAGAIEATVNNPTGISTLDIDAVSAEAGISFNDTATNTGKSIIQALGFKNSAGGNLTGANPNILETGPFSKKYDPTTAAKDMSSGVITPQFSKDITVYDAQGLSHTVTLNVLKLSTNTWAVELTATPASDVTSATGDGQIVSGTVTFNGDGTLDTVSPSLQTPVTIAWKNGAAQSTIALGLGTPQKSDGLAQFAGSSDVSQAIQNGSPTGQLTGVTIDTNGFVTASFSNGQTQKLYQVPLASVTNANGMESVTGDAYKNTLASGDATLSYAGQNGTGTITASALEQSNVDLSTQLTDLIVAQQAYGANTRVLTVTSQLLQELNQIIQ